MLEGRHSSFVDCVGFKHEAFYEETLSVDEVNHNEEVRTKWIRNKERAMRLSNNMLLFKNARLR